MKASKTMDGWCEGLNGLSGLVGMTHVRRERERERERERVVMPGCSKSNMLPSLD